MYLRLAARRGMGDPGGGLSGLTEDCGGREDPLEYEANP